MNSHFMKINRHLFVLLEIASLHSQEEMSWLVRHVRGVHDKKKPHNCEKCEKNLFPKISFEWAHLKKISWKYQKNCLWQLWQKIHRKEIIITPQNNNSRGNQTIQMWLLWIKFRHNRNTHSKSQNCFMMNSTRDQKLKILLWIWNKYFIFLTG